MSNIYRLIIFLPLFILGCAPNVIDEDKVKQKIESLDMTIFSKNGDKIYSITSPKSSYDNIELKFELNKPIINIFNGEETNSLYVEPSCSLIFVDKSGNKGSNNNPIIRVLSKTL